MSTEYYAKIIPSRERKEQLKKAIDNDDFMAVRNLCNKCYGKVEVYYDEEDALQGGELKLGRKSGEFKFAWNPNAFLIRHGHFEQIEEKAWHWVEDPSTLHYLYPLTKEGIKSFLDRDDVLVFDEYGEELDKSVFFNDAIEWSKEGIDMAEYHKAHPKDSWSYRDDSDIIKLLRKEGYEFTDSTGYEFYSDGLRFVPSIQ